MYKTQTKLTALNAQIIVTRSLEAQLIGISSCTRACLPLMDMAQ